MTETEEVFWIGGATQWGGDPAVGIRALRFDQDGTGSLTASVGVGPNPMYSVVAPCGSLMVSHEVGAGTITRFLDPARLLEGTTGPSASAPTGSADPTSIATARFADGTRVVLAANYSGGALSVNRVTDDGLDPASLVIQYEGSGPVADRQEASHPHQVVVDGDLVLVPDLGTDAIHVHQMQDLAAGSSAHRDIALPAGSGPRHLVVSEGCAIVACELDGLVRVVSIETGNLITDASPTIRASDSVPNFPSAIRLTGRGHVLVGNRGPDTLGVLKWEPMVESLQYVNEYLCGGQHPRDFQLTADESKIVVANLESNSVTVLKYNDVDGSMTVVQTLQTPSPTCAVRQAL